MNCIICRNLGPASFLTKDSKTYWSCNFCDGKYLDTSHYIHLDEEKERYLEHNNQIDDMAYRSFLGKLALPFQEKLSPGDTGLDFGCGHGPALADMLKKDGFEVSLYDPFFSPDKEALLRTYDFITCTETAEHFHDPFKEFNKLDSMLKPGGWLGVMTCFLTTDDEFENWYYRRDPTHVTFYSEKTFDVIAAQRNWDCEIKSKDIVLLQKPHE